MFLSTAGIHHDALWEQWFVGSGVKEDVRTLEERASIYVHATDVVRFVSHLHSPHFSTNGSFHQSKPNITVIYSML